MFYADNPSSDILQGDIFAGLVSFGLIPSKFLTVSTLSREHNPCFSMDLGFGYSAIVSPSCEIPKREYLAFCPLLPLHKRIRQVEFLNDDPTRLNNEVDPENSMPKPKWDIKSEEEKAALKRKGKTYAFLNNFVFEGIDGFFSDYLMIDFNFVFNINSKYLGKKNKLLLAPRVLQLSFESQRALRLKLANYYFREPEEACQVGR